MTKKLLPLCFILIFASNISAQILDVDNNSYTSVVIGQQEWLSTNLRVKHYSDGTPIPQVTSASAWASTNTGAWCYVNDDPETEEEYGLFYNKYALMGVHDNDENTPNKSIVINGWKIPNSDEFNILIDNAGGTSNAGQNLKSVSGWNSFNGNSGNGNNSTGYNAFPAGNRQQTTGVYANFGDNAVFWTEELLFYALNFVNSNVQIDAATQQGRGNSLRLIKDNTASTNSNSIFNFSIYPNPTKEYINIDCSSLESITIYNILGKELIKVTSNRINVSSLSKGVYFIKVSDGINSSTKKFIKN
jgi:uncharacterized protein (TIGR02145 family)